MQRATLVWIVAGTLVGCANKPNADQASTNPEPAPAAEDPAATTEEPAAEETEPAAEEPAEPELPDTLVDAENVAAQGYDVVAYQKDKKAEKGDPKFEVEHDGVKYRFSSEKHKKAFAKSPDKYIPAYGGYCAFAMAAQGKKVPPDPESFTVQDGRTLLFFKGNLNGKDIDTLPAWQQDAANLLKAADAKWAEATAATADAGEATPAATDGDAAAAKTKAK